MLVSDEKDFLFVHVPKTGGSSVRRALGPFALKPDRSVWNRVRTKLGLHRDYRRCAFPRHAPYRMAVDAIPSERLEQLFTFAFVRNPWDRLVSSYAYILSRVDHHLHGRVAALDGFAAYVELEVRRDRTSQRALLAGPDGDVSVDFVGRFERLESDFAEVASRLGVTVDLPVANRTDHDPYASYYTPESAALVARHWSEDVETFGYAFEPAT